MPLSEFFKLICLLQRSHFHRHIHIMVWYGMACPVRLDLVFPIFFLCCSFFFVRTLFPPLSIYINRRRHKVTLSRPNTKYANEYSLTIINDVSRMPSRKLIKGRKIHECLLGHTIPSPYKKLVYQSASFSFSFSPFLYECFRKGAECSYVIKSTFAIVEQLVLLYFG